MNLAGQLWERCSSSSSSDTPRTLSRYAAGAGAGGSSRERERTFLKNRRVGSVRNLLFPIPGGRLYVRRNKEGRGPGSIPAVPLRPPSPGGLVSEQAQPEPIVINGSLSPGANLSTGQLPDTHNTRDKDSHLLALTWCQMG